MERGDGSCGGSRAWPCLSLGNKKTPALSLLCASQAFPPLHPTGCWRMGAGHRVPSAAGEPPGASMPPQQHPGTLRGWVFTVGTKCPCHSRALGGCSWGWVLAVGTGCPCHSTALCGCSWGWVLAVGTRCPCHSRALRGCSLWGSGVPITTGLWAGARGDGCSQ